MAVRNQQEGQRQSQANDCPQIGGILIEFRQHLCTLQPLGDQAIRLLTENLGPHQNEDHSGDDQ